MIIYVDLIDKRILKRWVGYEKRKVKTKCRYWKIHFVSRISTQCAAVRIACAGAHEACDMR